MKVPTAEKADEVALGAKLKAGGVLAEEGVARSGQRCLCRRNLAGDLPIGRSGR